MEAISCQIPVGAAVNDHLTPLDDDVYIPPPLTTAVRKTPLLLLAIDHQLAVGADVSVQLLTPMMIY